ncbi:MAG TPA: NAD(P)H:quinone oxidoreductase [Anaerolineaceae bacterium]|nr:NAD(P)H:quinone oxidoreductase [Anaerolineaceae bacterium]HPN54061.1 NAD(P)H:quinone oxidoreductase [Anaerolineaceae bacterium]
MSNVKLSIIYYSSTGTIYTLAKAMEEAALQAGAEVRLRKVTELAPEAAIAANPAWKAHLEATADVPTVSLEDLEWADAYLFGTPTRFGNVAAQMKQFLDTTGSLWYHGKLSNKVVSGFTSAGNAHGGQETTLLALYNTFYHWGAVIVPPGYTDPLLFAAGGNPYGISATATGAPVDPAVLEAARYSARRVVNVAGWLKNGKPAV